MSEWKMYGVYSTQNKRDNCYAWDIFFAYLRSCNVNRWPRESAWPAKITYGLGSVRRIPFPTPTSTVHLRLQWRGRLWLTTASKDKPPAVGNT